MSQYVNLSDSIFTDIIKVGMGDTIDGAFNWFHIQVNDGTLDSGKEHQFDLGNRYMVIIDRMINYVDEHNKSFPVSLVATAKEMYQKIDNFATKVIQENQDIYGVKLISVQDGLVTFKFVNKYKWMDKVIDTVKDDDVKVGVNGDKLVIDGAGKYVPDCRIEVTKKPVAGADYQVTIAGKAPRDGKVTFFASTDAGFISEAMSKLSKFFKKDED